MAYGTVKVDNITFTNGGIDQTVTVSGIVQSISGNITATGTIQAATIIGTSTVSGATVTGNAGVFTTVTGGSAGFTTVTGTTVTGTTANFATISGTTITGGAVTVASGTFSGNSTAAAFIPTGSTVPTNGLYSPAANSVALSTGGVQRVTVNTTVVDSSLPFSVYTASAGASLTGLTINNSSDNASTGARIALQPSTTFNRGCHIEAINSGAGGQPCDLIFGTNPAYSTSTERLRITSAGLVGVGTSSPVSGAQLTVAGSALAVTGQNLDHSANSIRIGQEGSGAAQIRCYGPNTSTNGSLTFKMSRSDGTNSQDVVIDGSGRLGIGTSSPNELLEVRGTQDQGIRLTSTAGSGEGANLQWYSEQTGDNKITAEIESDGSGTGGNLFFKTRSTAGVLTDRLLIDNAGRVGIGTTSPASLLDVRSGASPNAANLLVGLSGSNNYFVANNNIFQDGASNEKARIDSSGRLLVGTSSARTYTTGGAGGNHKLQIETAGATSIFTTAGIYSNSDVADIGAYLELGRSKGTSLGAVTAVAQNDILGEIRFAGTNGTGANSAASIAGYVDGAVSGGGANDMPGRLVFSTTADGASSPTERMRISSAGTTYFGITSDPSSTVNGFSVLNNGVFNAYASGNAPAWLNRNTNDGKIVSLRQDDIEEGTISVSGTTVSYNGAHLSRWSQLPSGAERTEILRGSVLSNIDEMCEWGDEDNEQLNRMKVSDVEGDKNVAGVFQAWDDDDDTYTNDFYCAMTGDFIIRIAAGVTVERGDLLMSAGDGTAKPQDDDIIRSRTIAKVTSTNVSCTYPDGSYCVPCVLMAC